MKDKRGQYGLFDRDAPYVRDSDTSEAAAAQIAPDAKTLRAIVLAYVKGRGSATCDEVEVALGMRHQTASARICELHERLFLVDSGQRRKTRSGRLATVWVPNHR